MIFSRYITFSDQVQDGQGVRGGSLEWLLCLLLLFILFRVNSVSKKKCKYSLLYVHPEIIFKVWMMFTYPRQHNRALTFFQKPSISDIPFPLSSMIHGIISRKVNLVWINNTLHYRTRRKELISKAVFYDGDENAESSWEWIVSSIYGHFKGWL